MRIPQGTPEKEWWDWRSWLARQVVALKAVGSSPISHPRKKEKHRTVRAKARAYRSARTVSKRGVRADICTPGGAFFQTRLCAEGKTESTPRRADRKTESGCSAVGSARGLGPRCRRFESCHPDQKSAENEVFRPTFG